MNFSVVKHGCDHFAPYWLVKVEGRWTTYNTAYENEPSAVEIGACVAKAVMGEQRILVERVERHSKWAD